MNDHKKMKRNNTFFIIPKYFYHLREIYFPSYYYSFLFSQRNIEQNYYFLNLRRNKHSFLFLLFYFYKFFFYGSSVVKCVFGYLVNFGFLVLVGAISLIKRVQWNRYFRKINYVFTLITKYVEFTYNSNCIAFLRKYLIHIGCEYTTTKILKYIIIC